MNKPTRPSYERSSVARFLRKINKNGPVPSHCPELGRCWIWTGATNENGYGKLQRKGVSWLAHRFAYVHLVAEISDGLFIRHRCDNPPCVNPAHLIPGTHGDNMQDMLERGRNPGATRKVCKWGHDLTIPGAILHRTHKNSCKECVLDRERKARERKRGGSARKPKVNDEQVADIRARRAAGEDLGLLATEYGVTKSYICGIASGRFRQEKAA